MTTNTDANTQQILNELETDRKEIYRLRIRNYSTITGGIALLIISVYLGLLMPGLIAGGMVIITGFVLLNKAKLKEDAYRYKFKYTLLANALKSIDESLQIDDSMAITEAEFIATNLFNQSPDRYHSDDCVYGYAGKTKFSFSEVHAEYKTEVQTKNGRRTEWHDILKGIVFSADFNKNFNGLTVVRPKDLGGTISSWISSAIPLFSSSQKAVKLENPEFDNTFLTYSHDQVEARYILTPAMMERLCALNKRSRSTISVSFTGSTVHIAFPRSKDYFEPPIKKSLLDIDLLSEDLALIRFMYGIIQELDLNTRIWGKE